MSAVLERQHFSVSRAAEYFTTAPRTRITVTIPGLVDRYH